MSKNTPSKKPAWNQAASRAFNGLHGVISQKIELFLSKLSLYTILNCYCNELRRLVGLCTVIIYDCALTDETESVCTKFN
jgi:hypothetical protein